MKILLLKKLLKCYTTAPRQLIAHLSLVCCIDLTKAQRDQGQKCPPARDLWLSPCLFRADLLLVGFQLLVLSCSVIKPAVTSLPCSVEKKKVVGLFTQEYWALCLGAPASCRE